MESPFIIQDGMVGMVQFEEMFQCAGGLLQGRVDLVDFDGGQREKHAISPRQQLIDRRQPKGNHLGSSCGNPRRVTACWLAVNRSVGGPLKRWGLALRSDNLDGTTNPRQSRFRSAIHVLISLIPRDQPCFPLFRISEQTKRWIKCGSRSVGKE